MSIEKVLNFEADMDEIIENKEPDLMITLFSTNKREVANIIKKFKKEYKPLFLYSEPKVFSTIIGFRDLRKKEDNKASSMTI